MSFFSIQDVIIKLVILEASLLQILVFRALLGSIILLGFLYFTKREILEVEASERFWEKEWKRREQVAKDNAFWTPERVKKLGAAMNKLIEKDFGIADIIMRIIASTSDLNLSEGVEVEDLPHKSLYKLKDYVEYATRKMRKRR